MNESKLKRYAVFAAATALSTSLGDRHGCHPVLRGSEQLTEEDRVLLQTVARVILTDSAETLAEQVERQAPVERKIPRLTPTRSPFLVTAPEPPSRERVFFNGLGGFTPDGREYVISLAPGQTTPAPWSNVLANSQIGTVISESGGAYTWVDNAHEFRLTPWHNDPVSDTSGEAFTSVTK